MVLKSLWHSVQYCNWLHGWLKKHVVYKKRNLIVNIMTTFKRCTIENTYYKNVPTGEDVPQIVRSIFDDTVWITNVRSYYTQTCWAKCKISIACTSIFHFLRQEVGLFIQTAGVQRRPLGVRRRHSCRSAEVCMVLACVINVIFITKIIICLFLQQQKTSNRLAKKKKKL